MKKISLLSLLLLFLINNPAFSQATVVLKAGGNITTPGDWGAAPDGTASTLSDFTANNSYSFTNLNSALTLSSAWNITSSSTVTIGNSTNAFSLTLASGGVIGSTTPSLQPRVAVRNNGTFIVQDPLFPFTPSKTFPQNGSTIVFDVGAPDIQVLGGAYSNLIINDDVSLNDFAVVVSKTLTINSGKKLTLGGNGITINGAIAGSGSIVGDAFATMAFGGSGNLGTIIFDTGNELLSDLTLAAGSSTLTLGTDLTIDGGASGLSMNGTNISLNGKNLTIGNTFLDFGTASIIGSTTSTLDISANQGITGSLNMATSNNTLATLNLNSAGNTLSLGNTVNILDFVNVSAGTLASGGNLNLVASNGRVGSIGPVGGTISGNVSVNSFFPAGTTGWTLLGVNGVTGKTFNDLQGQFAITCTDCPYTPSAVGNFTSVQGWSEPTGTYVTSYGTGSSFSPGQGYWVYLGNSAPGGTSSDMTWNFTGSASQGNITIALTKGGAGYNLIANPYACPLSWTTLFNDQTSAARIQNTVYYYNRNTGGSATYQVGTGGTGGGADQLPAGQGFFVLRTGASTRTLTIKESHKTTNNTVNLLKPSGKSILSEQNAFRLNLKGQYDNDDAIFKIDPTADINFNDEDAKKMFALPRTFGGQPTLVNKASISSKDAQGNDMAINWIPPMNTTYTIPVLVKVGFTGSYTLNASEFDNYQSCIVVKDKLTGTLTDLKVKDYVFNIKDTTNTPRFELLVCANGSGAVSVPEFLASTNLSINQVADGVVVKTNYNDNTKSVVSVYNIMGQKIVDDATMEGKQSLQLNVGDKHQVLLIKIVNDKESLTKKVLMN